MTDRERTILRALRAALKRADDTPGMRISILRLAITDVIADLEQAEDPTT